VINLSPIFLTFIASFDAGFVFDFELKKLIVYFDTINNKM